MVLSELLPPATCCKSVKRFDVDCETGSLLLAKLFELFVALFVLLLLVEFKLLLLFEFEIVVFELLVRICLIVSIVLGRPDSVESEPTPDSPLISLEAKLIGAFGELP